MDAFGSAVGRSNTCMLIHVRGFPVVVVGRHAYEGKSCELIEPYGTVGDVVGTCICGKDPKPLGSSRDGPGIW